MLEFLKNALTLSLVTGFLITLFIYIDSKINKNEKTKSEYMRIFIISGIVTYCIIPFYHVPKKILKEIIDVNPPSF